MDIWAVHLEFRPPVGRWLFDTDDFDRLIDELAAWRPSRLWSWDRYAIQLRIRDCDSTRAVRRAVSLHDQALHAVGFASGKLVRVEVQTTAEMRRAWAAEDRRECENAMSRVHALDCPDVYASTRALLAAVTAGEVTDIVERFVATIGASVRKGEPDPTPGSTSVDLRRAGGARRYAVAEGLSVAGLLLEQSLPNLLADADAALARLRLRSSPR